MTSVPLLRPGVAGINVMLMVQLAPTAMFAPQAFVCAKSPLAVMLEISNGSSPVLLRVTGSAGLVVLTTCSPKVSAGAERLTAGAMPIPLRLTTCGLSAALLATVIVPVLVPLSVGAKTTLRLQAAPGGKLGPQVFVWLKSLLAWILVMLADTVPGLVRVRTCGGLLVSTP
jgi:hypothetical protein